MAKGTKEQKVKSQVNLSKQQKQLVNATQPYIKRYINKTSNKGVQLPGEPLTAPTNPYQTQGQELALGAVPAQQRLAGQSEAALTRIMNRDPTDSTGIVETWQNPATDATDFLLNKVLYPETNPALQQAINAATRPITDQLLEEALPATRSGAYTTGGFGGSRQGIAEGLATGKAARAVGDTAANVANQGYQAGLGALTSAYGDLLGASTSAYGTRQGAFSQLYSNNLNAQLNALGLTPTVQAAQTMPALTTSAVGDVQQQQQQRELDENTYRELFKQMSPLMSAQSLLALAGASPGGGSTSTTQMPGNSPVSNILGGASLGTALLPGIGTVLGGVAGGGLSLL